MDDPRKTLPTKFDNCVGESLMTPDEIDKLISYVPLRGWMLEVGTASGVTAAQIALSRPECRTISVDPYHEHPERAADWLNNRKHHTQNLWIGTLPQLAMFTPVQFDLGVVDADHFHTGIYTDLLYLDKLVKPDGVLISHDYDLQDWPDVTIALHRFWRETNWKMIDREGCLVVMRRSP